MWSCLGETPKDPRNGQKQVMGENRAGQGKGGSNDCYAEMEKPGKQRSSFRALKKMKFLSGKP